MTVSYWLNRPRHEKKERTTADIAVIGAGIAGLSLAYWLKKRAPQLKVAVLDKGRFAGEASGRNAGFVTCGSIVHFKKMRDQFGFEKALSIWRISELNHQLLRAELIGASNGQLFDYQLTGSCTVAPSETDLSQYESLVSELKAAGVDFSIVDPSTIEADFGVKALSGGAFYRGDGFIHPVKLLSAIRDHLVTAGGVDIFEHEPVFEIRRGSDAYSSSSVSSENDWELETPNRFVRARTVVLATNAFTRTLMPELASWVVPGRGQILVTEPTAQFIRGPCYYTPTLTYFRQLPTGEVLLGGFRNLSPQDEATLADETTSVIQSALDDFLFQHLPTASALKVKHRWSGAMAFTPDGQPLVGELPGKKGLFVQVGCSGHGMGLGFALGKLLADHILHGEPVPQAFAPFRLTPST